MCLFVCASVCGRMSMTIPRALCESDVGLFVSVCVFARVCTCACVRVYVVMCVRVCVRVQVCDHTEATV